MRNVLSFLAVLLLVVSCQTPPSPPAPVVPETTPAVVNEPEPAATPVPAVEQGFPVSAEKKQTSLTEIQALVDKLNGIISKKAFSEWKTYLDQSYIQTYGDPVRLKDYSANSPYLKQFNIKLKTLEDYFKFVVVSSRADGKDRVDDITFVDENRVNVWTVVDNERVLLYLLKLYGKEWKISSW